MTDANKPAAGELLPAIGSGAPSGAISPSEKDRRALIRARAIAMAEQAGFERGFERGLAQGATEGETIAGKAAGEAFDRALQEQGLAQIKAHERHLKTSRREAFLSGALFVGAPAAVLASIGTYFAAQAWLDAGIDTALKYQANQSIVDQLRAAAGER